MLNMKKNYKLFVFLPIIIERNLNKITKVLTYRSYILCIFKPNEACYVKTLKCFCCAQDYIRTDTTGKH